MKRRITQGQRSKALATQQMVIRHSLSYERALYNNRYKEVKAVIPQMLEIPYKDWITKVPLLLEAKYLPKLISNLYKSTGVPVAREAVNDFLGQKAAPDMWEEVVSRWVQNNAGKKVKIIKENYQEWFRNYLKETLDPKLSVEEMVSSLYNTVSKDFSALQEWQVRRIIQTESLTSMSVAASESVKELNIPFVKTWVISGNNTRPAHAIMDGTTIEDTELFIVDGEQMEFPRDGNYGASAGNIINCACTVIREPK